MASSLPSQDALKLGRGNQRFTVRYRCAPATPGKLHVAGDHEYQHAWLYNVSHTGIGLILSRPVPRGALVVIQARSHDRRRTFELAANVMHSTMLNQTDWLIGCDLIQELNDEQLDQLL